MHSILGNTRKADIIFRRSGQFDISAKIAQRLHLERGDVVDIMVEAGEFYLYVKKKRPMIGRHTAMVFPTKGRSNHFRGSSRLLCNAILRECGAVDNARLCAGDPIETDQGALIPIITKILL
ncbi:MAG: AbrB/MazE/SpoVT family DNA-binding domain-containing protein [Rikenellaceae bacterium]